ncbi:MAG: LLM class F420-dependent oxidoreductase [Acidimicrobiales bacterium]|nr:LLM class F420-dependent oxidoreductase [Acidimicrobiales bacterium]
MDLRIFVEPQQGTTYARLRALAQEAEALGFDAFFTSDHYLNMGDGDGLPGPNDAWTTLAGLARDTERLRLGTLVTPITFRLPGPLAIAVAQVDEMSAGRVELGLGAGWFEDEHRAYGIPFPAIGDRFDQLEEQLAIITGLWETPIGETFSFSGEHYTIDGSPALAVPTQAPRPPIVMGGYGPKRTPRLAATYAQEFNLPFPPSGIYAAFADVVRAACEAQDRDPASMTFSTAQVLCCGEDEGEIERRAAAIGREVDELRENGVAGTPAECADKLRGLAAEGATRVYLQVLDDTDLDHIRLVAAAVAPLLD